jgi:hypothetical protein
MANYWSITSNKPRCQPLFENRFVKEKRDGDIVRSVSTYVLCTILHSSQPRFVKERKA